MPKSIAAPYNQQNTSNVRARRYAQATEWAGLLEHQHRQWADLHNPWGGHVWDPPAVTTAGYETHVNEGAGRDLNTVNPTGTCRREVAGQQAQIAIMAAGKNIRLHVDFINMETGTTLATRTVDFSTSAYEVKRDVFSVDWADVASHVPLDEDWSNGREEPELIRTRITYTELTTGGGELAGVLVGEPKITDPADLISATDIWTPYDLTASYSATWLTLRDLGRVWQDSGGTTSADADGDPVGLVEDPLGLADWGQPDSGERPELDTDVTLAGYPTLKFTDRSTREYLFAPVGGSSTDYTFFCLVRLDNWAFAQREEWMLWNNNTDQATPIDWGVDASGRHSHWRGPAAGQVYDGLDLSQKAFMDGPNTWAMVAIRQERTAADSVTVDIFTEHDKATVVGDWEDWYDEVAVGGSLTLETSDRPMQGNIAEALCVFASLTDAEVERVFDYWEWVYFTGAPPT